MKRELLQKLHDWSKSSTRVPLILRGARQVGKSWLVREFAKSFETFIEINFETNKTVCQAFVGDISVSALLEKISLYFGKQIIPGKTLLFFDEVQECQEAIQYLRYFKEELPNLHVVAAGSLLDFKIEKIGMPVGRVEFLYLTPLSFAEFLIACGREDLREYIWKQEYDLVLDKKIKEYLRTYIWLGGMPEVVYTWITHQEVQACRNVQDRLIIAYREDFVKYAKKQQILYVDKVFSNIPFQLGNKFKYIHVDKEVRSKILKDALHLLQMAGIAHICCHTSAQRLPLAASKDENRFKVFFLDIGLAQRILGITYQDWIVNEILVENLGAIAEQFVAQEFVAYNSFHEEYELFYWHKESKNSNAEVDFLVVKDSQLIPIEVKAGKTGWLKSLHIYLETHKNVLYGLKISENGFSRHENIVEIPLYGIESWLKT